MTVSTPFGPVVPFGAIGTVGEAAAYAYGSHLAAQKTCPAASSAYLSVAQDLDNLQGAISAEEATNRILEVNTLCKANKLNPKMPTPDPYTMLKVDPGTGQTKVVIVPTAGGDAKPPFKKAGLPWWAIVGLAGVGYWLYKDMGKKRRRS